MCIASTCMQQTDADKAGNPAVPYALVAQTYCAAVAATAQADTTCGAAAMTALVACSTQACIDALTASAASCATFANFVTCFTSQFDPTGITTGVPGLPYSGDNLVQHVATTTLCGATVCNATTRAMATDLTCGAAAYAALLHAPAVATFNHPAQQTTCASFAAAAACYASNCFVDRPVAATAVAPFMTASATVYSATAAIALGDAMCGAAAVNALLLCPDATPNVRRSSSTLRVSERSLACRWPCTRPLPRPGAAVATSQVSRRRWAKCRNASCSSRMLHEPTGSRRRCFSGRGSGRAAAWTAMMDEMV
ncbi:Aste57867_21628 [Aphanomyces stellatus]|uniref:Aste57867_21628 protein n=1 Tax=Aphanomyces stellatus TaxID=120398 RepID=A0A485LI15_9STRA|nr:hypothetical protein As57867_021559 [Aphanomyces stellatus]VFT98298.1 Aste57867_21628 [Aphanomyces stellatus]